ncbi:MAG: SpoIIE family protein phosphatase [Spirochaetota bacterium]
MKKVLSSIDQAVLLRAIEQSPASIVITDTNGIIQYVNPKFEAITGYSFAEAIGKNPRILKSGYQPLKFYENMWNTILRGEVWDGIFHNKRKDGSFFWEHCVIAPVVDEKGNVTHFVAIKEDITEKKEQEEEILKRNEIINKDLEYARRVQHSIINTKVPDFPGLHIVTRYIPYDYVGGDFFTIQSVNNSLCVFMADITGHGVPAALFSSLLKYAVDKLWHEGIVNPDEFITTLNDELIDVLSGYYFTAVYGVLTPYNNGNFTMMYTRCGHPYPVLLSNNSVRMLDSTGTLLGIHTNINVTCDEVIMNKGDRLFLYTDGLIEMEIAGKKDLHFEQLVNAIKASNNLALADTVNSIVNSIVTNNKSVDDDIALIGIEVD